MGLSQAALSRSSAGLNVAGMYGQQGQYNQQMAAQAAGMSMGYDQMGNQMLTEEASIQEQRMGREQELRLSDRMAQGQVDEYNAGRMGRGIQTGLQIAGTAASMYGGIATGMAASSQAASYAQMAGAASSAYGASQQKDARGLNVNTRSGTEYNTAAGFQPGGPAGMGGRSGFSTALGADWSSMGGVGSYRSSPSLHRPSSRSNFTSPSMGYGGRSWRDQAPPSGFGSVGPKYSLNQPHDQGVFQRKTLRRKLRPPLPKSFGERWK